jgi:hypothetical protein
MTSPVSSARTYNGTRIESTSPGEAKGPRMVALCRSHTKQGRTGDWIAECHSGEVRAAKSPNFVGFP